MTLQELFAKENSWCQGFLTMPRGGDASSWCLMGGLIECYGECANAFYNAKVKLIASLRDEHGHGVSIYTYNDSPDRTIEDIRQLVKAAGV